MKIKELFISAIFSFIVFVIIISPGIFNYIPFLIHEKYLKDQLKEHIFITIFYLCFFILLWIIIYKLLTIKNPDDY